MRAGPPAVAGRNVFDASQEVDEREAAVCLIRTHTSFRSRERSPQGMTSPWPQCTPVTLGLQIATTALVRTSVVTFHRSKSHSGRSGRSARAVAQLVVSLFFVAASQLKTTSKTATDRRNGASLWSTDAPYATLSTPTQQSQQSRATSSTVGQDNNYDARRAVCVHARTSSMSPDISLTTWQPSYLADRYGTTVVLDAMINYLTISRRQQPALTNFNSTIMSSASPLALSLFACHAWRNDTAWCSAVTEQ